MIDMNGIPLSYIVRDNDNRDYKIILLNFIKECIACSPITSADYHADCKTAHQFIVSFTTELTSKDQFKPVLNSKNGRVSIKAPRDYCSGENNVKRRIAEADQFKENLQYKNEHGLTFETFLVKFQKSYNIYAQHGEGMTEGVEFLHHIGLESAVEATTVKITIKSAGTETYTTVTNHISTAISELPDYISRNRTGIVLSTSITLMDQSIPGIMLIRLPQG